jgi:hypothetical protein
MARQDYLDWMLAQYLDTFRAERLDGVYFDHATISRMCVRTPVLKGRPRDRQAWEYFSVRDFYKRLYEGMRATSPPDALLTMHSHGPPRALAAWADFTFIGEGWNVMFKGSHGWNQIKGNRRLYDPDYFRLPADYLEAQLLPRIGGVIAVLPQVKHALDPDQPERGRRYQRAFFARILPFDVPYWNSGSENRVLSDVNLALDRFGPLDGATVFPWWEERGVVARHDAVRVTSYAKDGRVLILAANWSDKPVEARLSLQHALLGLREDARARDAEVKGAKPGKPVRGEIEVHIPPRDLRILLLE